MAITFDRQVSASPDDASRRLAPDWFSTTIIYASVGDLSDSTYDYRAGLRFANVTIPHGATIVTAYLTLKARVLTGTIPASTLEGEAAVDAAAFSTAVTTMGGPGPLQT
ncbi:hypothetical protein LCGC14_2619310 [marine sediment metagenome]|uniref:Uncharacterized protein n=1 Tax=marine sediment metagenome TaxID=412755 RepID=A0A0F9A3S2_9ZZZZ